MLRRARSNEEGTTSTPAELDLPLSELHERLARRAAEIVVIGLGYVGLPLLKAVAEAGFRALGLDIDPHKVAELNLRGGLKRRESGSRP